MLRVLAACLLLAAPAKKKKSDVEIWPPPAENTDPDAKPKDPPKDDAPPAKDAPPPPAKDAPVATQDEPLPDPKPAPEAKPAEEDEEDACAEAFDDCKEDCTVEHATDDTLHVQRGKKLPVVKCVQKCKAAYDGCAERKSQGMDDGPSDTRHDPPHGE